MAASVDGMTDAPRQQQDAVKAEDTGAQTSFQRLINAVQRGMFGLGFVLAKDYKPVTIILIVGYFFDLAQLLSFPLSDDERMPWSRAPGVGTVSSSLSFLTRAISANENPAAFLSLLVIAFLWVVSYLGLAYSVAARFSGDEPQSELALRALRVMTSLSSGPLYIPTSTVLLQGIACQNNDWLNTGLECSGPGHGIIAFILSINLLGFSLLAVFASLIWVDRSPASLNWGARQHGRYDASMIVIKLMLGFCYAVLNQQLVGTVFMAIVLMALGIAQAYVYAFAPVFVQRDINAMYSGGGCVLFYAALCLLIAQLVGPDQAYLSVFLGLPTIFGLGFFVARRRLDLIGRGHLRQCQSLADVHVWSRRRMQRYAALKHLAERSGVEDSGERDHYSMAEQKNERSWTTNESDEDDTDASDAEPQSARDDATINDDASSVQSGGSKPSQAAGRSMANSRRRRKKSQQTPKDGSTTQLIRGVSLQVVDQLAPEDVKVELKRVRAEAERGYQYGMERFNRDEMAFIQFGIFTRYFATFSFLECIALSRALKLNPSMDSKFYIFTRIRALRESDGSGLSPVDRVLFDGAFKEVMQMRLQAYRYMSRLWNTLSSSQPDMADILETGIQMKGTLEKIDSSFRRLMNLNSESTGVLRALAAYLIDLRSQPDRAGELLNKATRIEDSSRKQRMKLMQNVEFGAQTQAQSILEDGAAIITISGAATIGSSTKLGEIVHVTQSASRLFGYGASQLLGQNVAVIVPPPIDAVHNKLISSFGRRRTSMVVNSTRLVFGQRRAGELFPMWLQVSEAPPDERTAEPRFSAVVHEVVTQQDFITFAGPQLQFKVFGCSARAMELLGVEGEMLQQDDVSMAQYFPSIDSTYNETVPLSEADIRAIAGVPVVQDLREVLGIVRPAGMSGLFGASQGFGSANADTTGSEDASGSAEPPAPDAVGSSLHPIIGGPGRDYRGLSHTVGFSSPSRSVSKQPGGGAESKDGLSITRSRGRRSSKDMKSSRHDQLQAAILAGSSAQIKPLRQQRKPGVIPVRVLGVDTLIVGSCQRIVIPGVIPFYILRYNSLQYSFQSKAGPGSVGGGSVGGVEMPRRSSMTLRDLSGSHQQTSAGGSNARMAAAKAAKRYGSEAWDARTFSKSSLASFTGADQLHSMQRETPVPVDMPHGFQPKAGIPGTVQESKHGEPMPTSDSVREIGGDASDRDLALGRLPRRSAPGTGAGDRDGVTAGNSTKSNLDNDDEDLLGDLDEETKEEGGDMTGNGPGDSVNEAVSRSNTPDSVAMELGDETRRGAGSRDTSSPDHAHVARAEGPHASPSLVANTGFVTSDSPEGTSSVISGVHGQPAIPSLVEQTYDSQGVALHLAPGDEAANRDRRPSSGTFPRPALKKVPSRARGILKAGKNHQPMSRGQSNSALLPSADPDMSGPDAFPDDASVSVRSVSIKETPGMSTGDEGGGDKARSFHSGTGSTRSTIARIHQLSKGAVEPEIRQIRIVLVILMVAVLGLGVGIVLYIRNVVSVIRNNSSSVWISGQRRRAMQNGIDTVLWMSFQQFDVNGTVTGSTSVLDSVQDTVRRLQVDRIASELTIESPIEETEIGLETASELVQGLASGLPASPSSAGLTELAAVLAIERSVEGGFAPDADHTGGFSDNTAKGQQTSDLVGASHVHGGSKHRNARRMQYSTDAETALMAQNGVGALTLLRLISDEIQIAQAKLFELETPYRVSQFEGEFKAAMQLPLQAGGGTIFVPLVQHVQEIIAAMRRISRLNPQNVTVDHRDVLFLSMNSAMWDMAMGHSLELRYAEYAAVFPRTVQEVIIFGACVFFLYNVVGSIVFARFTTRLGSKVQLVLQTFLLLPRSMARRLANRSQKQLNKVLREINSELGSDSDDDSDDDGDDNDDAASTANESAHVAAAGPESSRTMKKESQSARHLLAESLGQVDDHSVSKEGSANRNMHLNSMVSAHNAAKSTRSFGSRRSRNSRWSSRKAREAALNKAMGNLREHKDSSQFVLRSTMWLLLPIVLVLAFISFFVLWQLQFTQILLRTSRRIIAASSLESQLAGTTNTMLSLNSAIARGQPNSRLIELARRADLQGQKTTAVSAVLTFGGQAVLSKLLVANSTNADLAFGSISNNEVLLDAIKSSADPGGKEAYEVLHGDSCDAVLWPNITTTVTLDQVSNSQAHPQESDKASQTYLETLALCRETEGGVISEGALSAVATVVFNLRQAVSAVFLDLTGLPPPSMRSNQASDVSVIRRQRLLGSEQENAGDQGDMGNNELDGPGDSLPLHLRGTAEGMWESMWASRADDEGDWTGKQDSSTIRSSHFDQEGDEEAESRELQLSNDGFNSTQPALSYSTVATMVDFTIRIRSIVNPFLLHSISVVRINFFLGLNSTLINGQNLVEVAAWVFVGVFLLTSVLYWPAVAALNLPLSSARQMLLLLPEETVLRITVLRTALYRIATEHERSLAGNSKVSPEGEGGEGGSGDAAAGGLATGGP